MDEQLRSALGLEAPDGSNLDDTPENMDHLPDALEGSSNISS
jgi:hypothetical protein